MAPHHVLDEKDLLLRLREGDERAFELLYHQYKGLLYVHACKRLNTREEVKDIIHDIFANLWENREELDIHTNLSAYLYQAVRNRVINTNLKSRKAEEYIQSFGDFIKDYSSTTDHLARERMLVSLIDKEIQSLPERMRQVFELSRKEGFSHKEIAERLNLSEQSVRSHIKGALKILRLRLGVVFLFTFISGI